MLYWPLPSSHLFRARATATVVGGPCERQGGEAGAPLTPRGGGSSERGDSGVRKTVDQSVRYLHGDATSAAGRRFTAHALASPPCRPPSGGTSPDAPLRVCPERSRRRGTVWPLR